MSASEVTQFCRSTPTVKQQLKNVKQASMLVYIRAEQNDLNDNLQHIS